MFIYGWNVKHLWWDWWVICVFVLLFGNTGDSFSRNHQSFFSTKYEDVGENSERCGYFYLWGVSNTSYAEPLEIFVISLRLFRSIWLKYFKCDSKKHIYRYKGWPTLTDPYLFVNFKEVTQRNTYSVTRGGQPSQIHIYLWILKR